MSNQLSIPLKRTSPLPIRQAVRDYLQKNHPDTHPDTYEWDVKCWETLRNGAYENNISASKAQILMK